MKEKEESKTEKKDTKKEILSWVITIGVAVVIALLIDSFIIVNASIPSGSMENTIMTGDRAMGFRLYYLFADPKRGDIIVFEYPDDESKLFIKRIIGEPGDKVEIKEGKVYINDSDVPLDEPYLKDSSDTRSFGPYQVPEDCYFVMGDNRILSGDARFWTNTYVRRDQIKGKALFRYWKGFKWLG